MPLPRHISLWCCLYWNEPKNTWASLINVLNILRFTQTQPFCVKKLDHEKRCLCMNGTENASFSYTFQKKITNPFWDMVDLTCSFWKPRKPNFLTSNMKTTRRKKKYSQHLHIHCPWLWFLILGFYFTSKILLVKPVLLVKPKQRSKKRLSQNATYSKVS